MPWIPRAELSSHPNRFIQVDKMPCDIYRPVAATNNLVFNRHELSTLSLSHSITLVRSLSPTQSYWLYLENPDEIFVTLCYQLYLPRTTSHTHTDESEWIFHIIRACSSCMLFGSLVCWSGVRVHNFLFNSIKVSPGSPNGRARANIEFLLFDLCIRRCRQHVLHNLRRCCCCCCYLLFSYISHFDFCYSLLLIFATFLSPPPRPTSRTPRDVQRSDLDHGFVVVVHV